MEKDFKSISEQICILKSRGLCLDEDKAKEILSDNNYYYLINGYKDMFVDKKEDKEVYKKNVTLEEIYSLYNFDSELRSNVLKYILKIERKMDTYIAYEFSKQYGHKNYLKEQNFNTDKFTLLKISDFISEILYNMNCQIKAGNKMLNHYIKKYNYIPLWVLIRIMTFGQVSHFYHFMKQKEQNKVARKFGIKEKELKNYIYNLSIARNICAHDEKLYDVNFKRSISLNFIHKNLNLNNTKLGSKDLFSIIIILKVLLSSSDFNKFYSILINDIEKLKVDVVSIDFNVILNKMGFPQNYKEILIIKK